MMFFFFKIEENRTPLLLSIYYLHECMYRYAYLFI